jgi:hypothetical protein
MLKKQHTKHWRGSSLLCLDKNSSKLSLFSRGWKTKRNGTERNETEKTVNFRKRNETEKNHKIKKRNGTKRKATGNEMKHNDII